MMTRWMDSAQAHYRRQEYAEAEERKKQPQTEAEVLRAYKSADAATKRELATLAKSNGWTAIDEWNARLDQRRAEHKEIARRQAARIQTPEEAAQQRQAAWRNGDTAMVDAITATVRERGWNTQMTTSTAPKDFNEYATELHDELTNVVAEHDAASRPWRDALTNKKVTREYVAEQTAKTITGNRERVTGILEGVRGYVSEAQAEYDKAYQSLTAHTGDTNEQLLAEIRAGKTWDRARRELDALDSEQVISATVSRIGNADPSVLGTYIQELPSYLASKGVRDAGEIVRHAVNTRPELQEAQARMVKASKLRDVITHNVQNISSRLEDITYQDTAPSDIGYVDPTTVKY